jgi:hypothetical protein
VKPRNSPETAIIYVIGGVIAIAVVAASFVQANMGGPRKDGRVDRRRRGDRARGRSVGPGLRQLQHILKEVE